MTPRKVYKELPNEINGFKIYGDLGCRKNTPKSLQKYRYCVIKCDTCNKYMEVTVSPLRNRKSKDCTKCRTKKQGAKLINPKKGERLYYIWQAIKQRCLNPNNPNFINYGGRGIIVYDGWVDTMYNFEKWSLENGYSDDLSIDRIDNDGNYEPDNCRWVCMKVQARNTRKLCKNNTSGFRGVTLSKDKKYKKWAANITVDYKVVHLGRYTTPEDAARAYDNYIIENNLEHTLNFEES